MVLKSRKKNSLNNLLANNLTVVLPMQNEKIRKHLLLMSTIKKNIYAAHIFIGCKFSISVCKYKC
jgi:hypothetical protein